MLLITKFSGDQILINPELIKSIEQAGDTVITLISGEKILVKENPDELQKRYLEYKRVCSGANPLNTQDAISLTTTN